jgi:hypothetical protein
MARDSGGRHGARRPGRRQGLSAALLMAAPPTAAGSTIASPPSRRAPYQRPEERTSQPSPALPSVEYCGCLPHEDFAFGGAFSVRSTCIVRCACWIWTARQISRRGGEIPSDLRRAIVTASEMCGRSDCHGRRAGCDGTARTERKRATQAAAGLGTGGRSDDRRGDPRRPGPGHARRCLERASMWPPVVAEARVPGQSSSCAHVSSVRRLPGTARSGRRHSCGRHECRPGCSLADEEGFRGTRGDDHLFHHAAGTAASGGISFFLLSGTGAPLCGAVELTARYPTLDLRG